MSPFQQRATEILDRSLHQDALDVLKKLKEIAVVIQEHLGECLYVSVSPDLCVHINSVYNANFHEVLIKLTPTCEYCCTNHSIEYDGLFPLKIQPENELCSNIDELESALLRKVERFQQHLCLVKTLIGAYVNID